MDTRSADTVLAFAEGLAPALVGPDSAGRLSQIDQRYGDIEAALQWFVDRRSADEALRLANSIARFWLTKQRFEEGSVWLDRALALPGGEPTSRGNGHMFAGFMAYWKGEDDRASMHFGRALEIARAIGDVPMSSRALGGLVRVALRSDVAEARRLAHEALAVADQAGDETARSNALHLLGAGAQTAGDLLEARDWMTQRLALVRRQQNEAMISSEASNLSMVERQLGNLERADELVREALEIARRRGDDFMKPFCLSGLAAIATERGELGRAATLIGAAEAMLEVQGAAWPPDERPHYERTVQRLAEAMGDAEFRHGRAAGRAMTSAEAVELALSRRARSRAAAPST